MYNGSDGARVRGAGGTGLAAPRKNVTRPTPRETWTVARCTNAGKARYQIGFGPHRLSKHFFIISLSLSLLLCCAKIMNE